MSSTNNPDCPIPNSFYSFEEQGLFTNCIECNKYLLDGEDYMIEKALRQYPGFEATDVVFDCAICMSCAMAMQNEISSESKKYIQEYLGDYFSSDYRMKLVDISDKPADLIEECLVSRKKRSECAEYQIFAFCKGRELNTAFAPYMISGDVLSDLSENLSKETRDNMGDFFNKHFSPDPKLVGNDPRLVFL